MSKYYSTKEQRIKWLLENQRLWEGVGSCSDNRILDTIYGMKEDGLYSKKMKPSALRTGVFNLIQTARRYRRYKSAGLIK